MSVNDQFDVGSGAQAPDQLARLHSLVDETIALEESIKQQEEDLKAQKAHLQKLKTGQLPDLMAELGLTGAPVDRGAYRITINDFVSGSLPKDPEAREKAINLLVSYGAADLIKTEVKASFGRNEHNQALSVAEGLREQGLAVELDSGVHAQTLHKFARERLAKGEPLDLDTLSLYTGKVAKIKKVD